MRRTQWIAGAALLCWLPAAMAGQAASSTAVAPQQAPEPAKQASPAPGDENAGPVDAIRRYSYERREEAVAAARKANADVDRRLDALQAEMDAQWGRMAAASRTRSEDAMRRLRERRTDLAEWYGGLRHGSAGVWSEVTTGFADSYHAMADALRRARDEFREQPKTRSTAPEQAQPAEGEPTKDKPTKDTPETDDRSPTFPQ